MADPCAARAWELKLAGLPQLARKIERCNRAPSMTGVYCRQRLCPSCSRYRAQRRAREVIVPAIERMRAGAFVTITYCSLSLDDLGPTISAWNAAAARLRRSPAWQPAQGAIGGREWKVTGDGTRWLVHAHLCVGGVPTGLEQLERWIADANREWAILTEGRGRVELHPRRPIVTTRASILRVASYVSKARDYSPAPGSLPLRALYDLAIGQHGRHTPVAWGMCTRRRRAS